MTSESIKKPELAAEAQIGFLEICDADGLEVLWDWFAPVEAIGSHVVIPDAGGPKTISHVIKDKNSFRYLKIPNPEMDQRFGCAIETAQYLIKKIGGDKFLYGDLPGPLTLAGEFRGVDHLMRDLYKDPPFAEDILRFASETVKSYYESMSTMAVDGVCICDPLSSGQVISKKHFERFGKPYLRNLVTTIKASGKLVIIHICGDISDRIEGIMEIGPDVLSLESKVDLALAKKLLNDKVAILGNLDVATTLLIGTPEQIKDQIITAIRKTGGKGHILGGGCDIAPGTPADNIRIWETVVANFALNSNSF